MCWNCVVEAGGDKIVLTDYHKNICNLIWEWYSAPDYDIDDGDHPINTCGGDLHIQLDDFNLEDHNLQDDWNKYSVYSLKTFALGQKIVDNLRKISIEERHAVVYNGGQYGAKPFPEIS